MRRALAVAAWLALFASAAGQVSTPAVNTAAPPPPTLCGNTSIPGANTIGSTASETAFSTICTIKSAQQLSGAVVHLHVGGVYKSGTGETAIGRVRANQTGTITPASDTAIIATPSLSGIAASGGSSQWWGDVFITFQTGATAIDVQGLLMFQATAANMLVPIPNTTTFSVDPTKDLTIYLTVQWGSASANNSMQLRTMVAK